MSYPREREHDTRATDLVSALTSLAGLAGQLGLPDYCDVLDALAEGAKLRLGVTA
jgi:hypothetical protein